MFPPRPWRRRKANVAVLATLLLSVIVGTLAIAVDGGLLQDNSRRVQSAADAAALAAATELYLNYPAMAAANFQSFDPGGAAATSATSSAATNGYPNDGTTATVTVNIPPASGPFVRQPGYAEVIVTCYQKRYFSSIWGGADLPVTRRAVARGRWAGTGKGITLLDPTTKDALNATGSGSVTVTGGASVYVDSSNGEAAGASGGGQLTAPEFDIAGGYSGNLNGTINTGVPPIPDPLAYLPVPTVPPDGTMTVTNLTQGNKQYVLTPGRYVNLPTFNTGDMVILQQASANSAGGVFYLDGGGFKSTGATILMDPLTSGGVMIYNNPQNSSNSQQIQISGNSAGIVSLSAPTSGPYAGILFWQNRTSSVPLSISGNGTFNLTGTFYAANAQLQISGNGNATIGSQYVSRTLSLSGNGNITINYNESGTGRKREVMLVE